MAPTDSSVLVLGETGTGKELIARTIHEHSRRQCRVMGKLNCATLPGSLIESELFGREKGAFTGALTRGLGRFELANGSTILLDEVGELPLELQPKLLRVPEEGEFERLGSPKTIKVDVRVIAATSRIWSRKSGTASSASKVFRATLPTVEIAARTHCQTCEEVERDYILHVLEVVGWRVRGEGGAAQILKVKATTLESRMQTLGISRHR